jgi:hypothetical protein
MFVLHLSLIPFFVGKSLVIGFEEEAYRELLT